MATPNKKVTGTASKRTRSKKSPAGLQPVIQNLFSQEEAETKALEENNIEVETQESTEQKVEIEEMTLEVCYI